MTQYLTFEEAASLLNVAHSTLYRWLSQEKVPGHKVGRQWRFVREELEDFLRGEEPGHELLQPLVDHLTPDPEEESAMNLQSLRSPEQLATNLLWDAADSGASVIHLQPSGAGHSLRYRTANGLDEVLELPGGALELLDEQWRKASSSIRNADHRRIYLHRDADGQQEQLQVRYQRVDTLVGTRLTLRLLREEHTSLTIDDIASGDDAAHLHKICDQPSGLVLVSGRSGSGKTTTAYVCLSELARDNSRVVFTIEEMPGHFLTGVNQLEIDMSDPKAYHNAFQAIFESDFDVLFITSPFSHRDRSLLWNSALRAAESGHLVFVQMEAESAEDAWQRFSEVVDRPAADYLVASCWQELDADDQGRRFARYQWHLSS